MYTGTSSQQDNRFSDKEKKLLKQTKFNDCLRQRIDMSRIKLEFIKPWIRKKLTEILKSEDDVIVDFLYNQLEEQYPDPKKIQISLIGFLNEKNARIFMAELWALLLSAQESPVGIPVSLVILKEEEFIKIKETEVRKEEIEKKDRERQNDKIRRRHSSSNKDRDRKYRDRSRSRRTRSRSRGPRSRSGGRRRSSDRSEGRHRDRIRNKRF